MTRYEHCPKCQGELCLDYHYTTGFRERCLECEFVGEPIKLSEVIAPGIWKWNKRRRDRRRGRQPRLLMKPMS